MYPVLINLWGYSLPSFGVMLALAILIGAFWISKRAKAIGQNPDVYIEGLMWMMISAIIGARLFYIGFFPALFWSDPVGMLFAQGGLVWYGGVVGFCIAAAVYTRKNHIPIGTFADVVAPPAALGLALGRIGCFLAGCCYGAVCPVSWTEPFSAPLLASWAGALAVHFPASHPTHGLAVYPTQLYESLAMFLTTFALARLDKAKAVDGQTMCLFFAAYGVIRFFLEYLRGDRLVWLAGLGFSASQVLSMVAILAGAISWLWLLQRKKSVCGSPRLNGVSHIL
jgi:phosphatidylglycerol---prolipoprotein diacylglyceryl transferase